METVPVPHAVLLDQDQTASTKLLWTALRRQPAASPADLETLTGLSRPTVHRGIRQVQAWKPPTTGPKARIPAALLTDPTVGAQAKLLYGMLQALPGFRHETGRFTYAALTELTHLAPNTLKRAVTELIAAQWVQVSQATRLSPILFTLGSPDRRNSQAAAAGAARRLKRAKFAGEAIMQEYLSLLIDSEEFTDNARPGWLVNPPTGERLELDRFYMAKVAFEFNGAQHYHETGRFTKEEAEAQHFRDLIKAGICLYEGIDLVIIHPVDLSLHAMVAKVGRRLPLRDIAAHQPLIDLLENASLAYRAAAR